MPFGLPSGLPSEPPSELAPKLPFESPSGPPDELLPSPEEYIPAPLAYFTTESGFIPATTNPPPPNRSLVELIYEAEGGANVVYVIQGVLPEDVPQRDEAEFAQADQFEPNTIRPEHEPIICRKVLRLRKAMTTVSTSKQSEHWNTVVKQDCFGGIEDLLLSYHITPIHKDVLQALVIELANMEKTRGRPKKRHGEYLASDAGLLLTNMKPIPSFTFAVEFKPKWLVQSPNAPPNSRRCRNCAMAKSGLKKTTFCPLYLVHERENRVESAVHTLLDRIGITKDYRFSDQVLKKVTRSFTEPEGDVYRILRRLREKQRQYDEHGILHLRDKPVDEGNPPARTQEWENLLTAMTLRDCSIFIRASWDDDQIEARATDLDFKSAGNVKLQKWWNDEATLVNHGYYTAVGAGATVEGDIETCALWVDSLKPQHTRDEVGTRSTM